MYIVPPKVLKKTPSKQFRPDLAIINELIPHFENWNNNFEKNTFYHVPVRIGNFGQIAELNFRLENTTKQKVCYYGSLTELDYLLFLK